MRYKGICDPQTLTATLGLLTRLIKTALSGNAEVVVQGLE